MTSKVDVVRRWMKVDEALCDPFGLYLPHFTRAHGVTRQLVYKDIEAFRALGQRIRFVREREVERMGALFGGRMSVSGTDRWCYEPDQRPLFTCNLKE